MLIIIILSVFKIGVILMSVSMLSSVILSVIMLSVILLSVVVPFECLQYLINRNSTIIILRTFNNFGFVMITQRDYYQLAPTPTVTMEQHAFKNLNSCLNTSIYCYLETSGPNVIKLFTAIIYGFT